MHKNMMTTLALVLVGFSSGHALASETLLSELFNAHQPGSAAVARSRPTAQPVARRTSGLPAGSACQLGSDCFSTACVQRVCMDLGGESPARLALAHEP